MSEKELKTLYNRFYVWYTGNAVETYKYNNAKHITTQLFEKFWKPQIENLFSQALQKRDEAIIKMLENTDVQMSVNGDVSKDEIAMAKFIYKAHIKHIIKKIESAIIPPNSINGILPSETDSAIK